VKTDVLDPRPPAPAAGLVPAPRVPDLARARVLLFDNGKLSADYGPRRVIFDAVRERLARDVPDAQLASRSQDLLLLDLREIEQLADAIAADGVDAVVLALVDAGVGMPTTVLAIALERRGIATCTICEGPGLLMAAAVARPAPFLAFVELPVILGADAATVRARADAVVEDVVVGLTGTPSLTAGTVDVRMPACRSATGTLRVEGVDPTEAFTELMAGSGLGDGFPLLAPTPERVEALLRACPDPEEVIWPPLPIRGTDVRARDVATIAAMAGVRPEWMPVVLAAYRGMAATEFRLFQAAITTHPGGTLVLLSGPATAGLGFAGGPGCLGPGYRANAAVGRSVALSLSFLLASLPGGADLTIQGSPAEYAYCCAEDVAASPWPGLHADLGVPDGTTVTVLRCEGPKNVLDHLSDTPEALLTGVARACATIHSNSAFMPAAQTVVFLNPAHARMIAAAGWSKQDVRRYLYDNARNPRDLVTGRGVVPLWPPSFDGVDPVPVALTPEDFLVVVAGAPGLASQVAVPWGLSRAVTNRLDAPPAG
jgi:hypothetical protein